MRLRPIDVYILDHFRRSMRTKIDFSELSALCRTYPCSDVESAVARLEHDARMLLRQTQDGKEWLELTREGRRYAGLASAESLERLEPLEMRL